jgi:hypothetical protein
MAVIDEMPAVGKQWRDTKRWVHSFYAATFFEDIRKEHDIKHLSEREFLDVLNEEVVEPTFENCAPGLSKPFDFSKIMANEVINP